MDTTVERLNEMRGAPVFDGSGEKIGSVDEIFYDEQTGKPEWLGIGTGLLGSKRVLVPLTGADMREDGVSVRYSKEQVKESPDIDSDEISEATERELYSYYGLTPSERRSDSVLPEGEPPAGGRPATEGRETMTRAEEELQVGKREQEAGRARLRKWVETEPVEADVELRRETARVTREPVDQPVSGAELGEQEVEVPLRQEEPVVEKEAVAKERIGLEKDVETERETVGGDVRKERVEIEGDVDKTRKK